VGFLLPMSIIIYAEHCDFLEEQNKKLKEEVKFLKQQLDYKSLGNPLTYGEDDDIVWVVFQIYGNYILFYITNCFHIISGGDVLQSTQIK